MPLKTSCSPLLYHISSAVPMGISNFRHSYTFWLYSSQQKIDASFAPSENLPCCAKNHPLMERSTALKAQMVSHFGPQIWQTRKTHVPEHHRNPTSGPCGPGLQPLTELTPRCTRQSLETAGVDQYLHLYSLIPYIYTYIYKYIHTLYIYIYAYIYNICIYKEKNNYLFIYSYKSAQKNEPFSLRSQGRPKQFIPSRGQSRNPQVRAKSTTDLEALRSVSTADLQVLGGPKTPKTHGILLDNNG